MSKQKKYKAPMPHNGKRVNDWEILHPYVERNGTSLLENITERGTKIDPKWGFGYQAELSGNNTTFSPDEKSRAQK